jgi:hypothetical protein
MKTFLLTIGLFFSLVVNSQSVTKTNYIGKMYAEIATSMKAQGISSYGKVGYDKDGQGKELTSYYAGFNAYFFGSIVYHFDEKGICDSYRIVASLFHKPAIINVLNSEFPASGQNNKGYGIKISDENSIVSIRVSKNN